MLRIKTSPNRIIIHSVKLADISANSEIIANDKMIFIFCLFSRLEIITIIEMIIEMIVSVFIFLFTALSLPTAEYLFVQALSY